MANTHAEVQHAQHAQESHGSLRYVIVLLALGALTMGTFGVSHIKMSEDAHLMAAIGIACVKVSLVVLFFMHLWEAEGSNKMVFVLAIVFVGVMMFFVLEDVAHRWRMTDPQGKDADPKHMFFAPADTSQYPIGETANKAETGSQPFTPKSE